ncbi:hypothetical protein SEEM1594_19607 [Salmonella enterica subsp. enterica serovar Muenchen str. baa1594]|nr:hypothetical protein SEEM1594_19607 [Salmonella enterica subsp. enterica serovar Muenchen str. baa1594]
MPGQMVKIPDRRSEGTLLFQEDAKDINHELQNSAEICVMLL